METRNEKWLESDSSWLARFERIIWHSEAPPHVINTILRHFVRFWIFWRESFEARKRRLAARGSRLGLAGSQNSLPQKLVTLTSDAKQRKQKSQHNPNNPHRFYTEVNPDTCIGSLLCYSRVLKDKETLKICNFDPEASDPFYNIELGPLQLMSL